MAPGHQSIRSPFIQSHPIEYNRLFHCRFQLPTRSQTKPRTDHTVYLHAWRWHRHLAIQPRNRLLCWTVRSHIRHAGLLSDHRLQENSVPLAFLFGLFVWKVYLRALDGTARPYDRSLYWWPGCHRQPPLRSHYRADGWIVLVL